MPEGSARLLADRDHRGRSGDLLGGGPRLPQERSGSASFWAARAQSSAARRQAPAMPHGSRAGFTRSTRKLGASARSSIRRPNRGRHRPGTGDPPGEIAREGAAPAAACSAAQLAAGRPRCEKRIPAEVGKPSHRWPAIADQQRCPVQSARLTARTPRCSPNFANAKCKQSRFGPESTACMSNTKAHGHPYSQMMCLAWLFL